VSDKIGNGAQHAVKWRPISLENSVQCCFCKFDCSLIVCKIFQFACYLPFSLSLISTSLAHACCKCCNLSISVVLIVQFTMKGMRVKNNTHIYVAQTSRNTMSITCDLYCCLLKQCEALRTCHLGFPIATK